MQTKQLTVLHFERDILNKTNKYEINYLHFIGRVETHLKEIRNHYIKKYDTEYEGSILMTLKNNMIMIRQSQHTPSCLHGLFVDEKSMLVFDTVFKIDEYLDTGSLEHIKEQWIFEGEK